MDSAGVIAGVGLVALTKWSLIDLLLLLVAAISSGPGSLGTPFRRWIDDVVLPRAKNLIEKVIQIPGKGIEFMNASIIQIYIRTYAGARFLVRT
jgi:hypothetical protein